MLIPIFYTLLKFYADIYVTRTGRVDETIQDWLLVFSFALLPLAFLGFWKFTPVYTAKRRVLTVVIFILFFLVSFSLRFAMVVLHTKQSQLEMPPSSSPYLLPAPLIYAAQLHLGYTLPER